MTAAPNLSAIRFSTATNIAGVVKDTAPNYTLKGHKYVLRNGHTRKAFTAIMLEPGRGATLCFRRVSTKKAPRWTGGRCLDWIIFDSLRQCGLSLWYEEVSE